MLSDVLLRGSSHCRFRALFVHATPTFYGFPSNVNSDAFPKTLQSPGWVNEKIESPAWVDTSLFRPLESVLAHIFAQTVECLASHKFELRRIASMVLPLLTEVMQWAYPVALESIYSAAMPLQSSWIALASSTSLRHSMNLILRLTHWFGLSRELDSPVQVSEQVPAPRPVCI